jgi:hypothetical protein
MGPVTLVAGTAAIVTSATLLVACLRLRSAVSFLLAVFVVAWAIVVAETMLLSIARSWSKGWMLAALAATLVIAFGVWAGSGRPRPSLAGAALGLRDVLRDPVVAVFGAAAAAAYGYLLVVALAIPPMDPDVLAYHMPRIVLWIQQHAVAPIPDAPSANLDANPPAAEIAQAVGPLLGGSDRYASLFQLGCAVVGAVAVAGIALRLGLSSAMAVFAGLVFASFPIVALQAPTAANDVATATVIVVIAYFGLGATRRELGLMALGVALALSTKASAVLALPAVGLLLVLARPAHRLPRLALAAAAGCAVGCWWYVVNLAHTGAWDGGLATEGDHVPSRAPEDVVLRLCRYLLHTVELTGVVGRDRLVFPIVGGLLLSAAVVARLLRRSRAAPLDLAVAGVIVAATPWLIAAFHEWAARAIARGWIAVGRTDLIGRIPRAVEARPSPGEAWFGPAFVVLWFVCVVIVVRSTTGQRRRALLAASVAAPALLYVTNSAAFTGGGTGQGRFFIAAAALAATTFGVVLRVRALAWAATSIAVLALGLSLVHYRARPAGIELFEPRKEATLWGAPRWQVNTAFAADVPEIVATERAGEHALRDAGTIAIAIGKYGPLYTVFGGGPWRTVTFVRRDGSIPEQAEYLVAFDPSLVHPSPSRWERVPGPTTWRLYRRLQPLG